MQVAKYFSSIGFEIDKKSITQVQRTFANIEARLGAFSRKMSKGLKIDFNISNFSVDQRKLNRVIGDALDIASTRTTFEVSRFAVNDRNLQAALMRAGQRAGSALNRTASTGPESHPSRRGGRVTAGVGFVGGASRFLAPALALGAGGYGLSQLNQRNQQVVSAQLQSQAVVQQAGGTAAQGVDSFQYLRREGNRIGFNYLEASGDYNKLISGLTGSGVSVEKSQKVFSGFAELARVNKLGKAEQNRLFRALSQVAGKGKLMSEELTGQIAEALPGGTALFAQAYQKQIGGSKTGSEAIQQLLADMKAGKVKSDILTFAGEAASQRANQGGALASASTASQAEQGRYQNVVSDLAVVASNNGVEEGFARIFRALSTGLSESTRLVEQLSRGFNEATIWTSKLLLFPQSFIRALEGRDSIVADWLGAKQVDELQSDWSEIQASLSSIWSMGNPSWLPGLKDVAQNLKDAFGIAGGISQRFRETSSVIGQIYADGEDPLAGASSAAWFGLKAAGSLGTEFAGKGLNMALDAVPFARFHPALQPVGTFANYLAKPGDPVAQYYMEQEAAAGIDTSQMYGADGSGWRDFNTQRNQAGARDLFGGNGFGASRSSAAAFQSSVDTYKQGTSQSQVNENKFDVNVVLQSGDPDEISKYFKVQFQNDIDTAMLHFEEK